MIKWLQAGFQRILLCRRFVLTNLLVSTFVQRPEVSDESKKARAFLQFAGAKGIMKTPITIITGYLGSGKTTLLRRILEAGQRIAVVMNEFGELDIDAATIKGKNVDIAELTGGCVCCSISGEFEAAVREIIERARPEHIVVETTGVVDPESLVYDVLENMDYLRLDSVVCVVDCDSLARYPEIGITSKKQIEMADVILLNKSDLVENSRLPEIENKISSINSEALAYRTVRCNVPVSLLFGIFSEKEAEKNSHNLENMESFAFETEKLLDRKKFEKFVSSMQNIFRAKGFVNFSDGTYLFNYVNSRSDFEKWKKEETRLVFIGEDIKKTESEVKKIFS